MISYASNTYGKDKNKDFFSNMKVSIRMADTWESIQQPIYCMPGEKDYLLTAEER